MKRADTRPQAQDRNWTQDHEHTDDLFYGLAHSVLFLSTIG